MSKEFVKTLVAIAALASKTMLAWASMRVPLGLPAIGRTRKLTKPWPSPVVSSGGNEKALLPGFGDLTTNVQFRGSTMYVTDVGGGLGTDEVYRGTISRATLDGVTGLDLFGGSIN